jgi:predicted DNA-binding transcriptional regulator YafY
MNSELTDIVVVLDRSGSMSVVLDAPFIAERQWHATQELVTERDGSVVLTMRVADTLELRRWILGFGASAEVLAPESLRDEIRKEAQAMVDRSEPPEVVPGQLHLPIADFLEELVLEKRG